MAMKNCSKIWTFAFIFGLSLAASDLVAADGDNLYVNNFSNTNDISRLSLTKGSGLVTRGSYTIGGRTSAMLRCRHTQSSGWESIIGAPALSSKVTHATVRYRVYFPSSGWQFRLQGKLPGLQPDQPHFGGNRHDPVEWNKWSVRLMWISTSTNINNGVDSKARPSIYIYDQNRALGSTGTHHKLDGVFFPKNQWQEISLYVKLNTHNGSTARSDGVVKLYRNGALAKTVSGLKLVGNIPSGQSLDKAKISKVVFHNYFGGSKTNPLDVPTTSTATCYFDDLTVKEGDRKL